jgi:hypothetical protein
MSHLERGYHANLLRIRAATCRDIAETRSASATRQELETEAAWCEAQAQKLDNAEEPASVSEKDPIRAHPKLDINAVDKPGTTVDKPTNGAAS